MPPLWRLIARPEPYLAVVLLVLIFLSADAARPPQQQIAAGWYVGAVHSYQRFGHPITHNFFRCRYNPTCSRYSIQAVQKYGLARGLVMTVRRVASCRATVKPNTLDPVAHIGGWFSAG